MTKHSPSIFHSLPNESIYLSTTVETDYKKKINEIETWLMNKGVRCLCEEDWKVHDLDTIDNVRSGVNNEHN